MTQFAGQIINSWQDGLQPVIIYQLRGLTPHRRQTHVTTTLHQFTAHHNQPRQRRQRRLQYAPHVDDHIAGTAPSAQLRKSPGFAFGKSFSRPQNLTRRRDHGEFLLSPRWYQPQLRRVSMQILRPRIEPTLRKVVANVEASSSRLRGKLISPRNKCEGRTDSNLSFCWARNVSANRPAFDTLPVAH